MTGVFEKDRVFAKKTGFFEKDRVFAKKTGFFEKDRVFAKKTGFFENNIICYDIIFKSGFFENDIICYDIIILKIFTGEFPKNTQQELNKINRVKNDILLTIIKKLFTACINK